MTFLAGFFGRNPSHHARELSREYREQCRRDKLEVARRIRAELGLNEDPRLAR